MQTEMQTEMRAALTLSQLNPSLYRRGWFVIHTVAGIRWRCDDKPTIIQRRELGRGQILVAGKSSWSFMELVYLVVDLCLPQNAEN
jgi:hypothetical protein